MTRQEELYSMTGANLILVADELGVKVSCNKARTSLKEAKAKVIDRILKAEVSDEPEEVIENNTNEISSNEIELPETDLSAPEESIEEIVGQDSLEDQEADEKRTEDKAKKSKGQRGKLIEWNGKSQNLGAWARELEITRQTLYARLYIQNWEVEKAFTTPGRKAK